MDVAAKCSEYGTMGMRMGKTKTGTKRVREKPGIHVGKETMYLDILFIRIPGAHVANKLMADQRHVGYITKVPRYLLDR